MLPISETLECEGQLWSTIKLTLLSSEQSVWVTQTCIPFHWVLKPVICTVPCRVKGSSPFWNHGRWESDIDRLNWWKYCCLSYVIWAHDYRSFISTTGRAHGGRIMLLLLHYCCCHLSCWKEALPLQCYCALGWPGFGLGQVSILPELTYVYWRIRYYFIIQSQTYLHIHLLVQWSRHHFWH